MAINQDAIEEGRAKETEEQAMAALKADLVERQASNNVETINKLRTMLDETAARKTPEMANVDAAIEEITPVIEPKQRSVRPYLAMHARYKTLPKWQQEFRTMDDDRIVGLYFRALARANQDGGQSMREIMGECRAGDLLEGDSAAGAPFDGTAGQLLPLPVSNYINIALYRALRFRNLMRMTTTTQGASLRVPRQNAIAQTSWEGESDAIAPGEGAIASDLNLVLKKQATLASLSSEILEDEVFGIVQWLTNDVTMLMAEDEDEKTYGSGNGTSEPAGLEANDTIVTMTTSNTSFVPAGAAQIANHFLVTDIDYFHVLKMFYALPESERRNASWGGPDQVMLTLSSIVDDNGRPIFRQANQEGGTIGDSLAAGQTGTVLGRPVFNLPGDEAAVPADSNTNRLYFGDFSRSVAGLERAGVRIESSRDSSFSTDMVDYKFVRRIDSGVIGNTIAARRQFVFSGGITGAGTPT